MDRGNGTGGLVPFLYFFYVGVLLILVILYLCFCFWDVFVKIG